MTITKHYPNWVERSGPDGDDPEETAEFNSVDELLEISWVKEWASDKGFYRFSASQSGPHKIHLMAEQDLGTHWWVVGTITGAGVVELPFWTPNYEGRK